MLEVGLVSARARSNQEISRRNGLAFDPAPVRKCAGFLPDGIVDGKFRNALFHLCKQRPHPLVTRAVP